VADPIQWAYSSAASGVRFDGPNLILCKDSSSIRDAEMAVSASFGSPISHVVHVSAEKEVPGVNARGIVASVTDMHAFRNLPIGAFPRRAVSRDLSSPNREHPISGGLVGAVTRPASRLPAGPIGKLRKTLGYRSRFLGAPFN
jgi:hypothetical protein